MCGTHTFTYTHTLHFIVSSHSQVWYSAYLSTRVGCCLFVDSLFICRLGIYLVYYAGSIGCKIGFRKKWKQNSFLGELRYQEEVTLQKKTILCQIRHVVRHTPLRISASYKEGLTFDPALTFRKQFIY